MNGTKVLGLVAVAAVLVVASPVRQAGAVSLINPGAATAVQDDTRQATTEVRWGHHHGWHRGWGHRRHGDGIAIAGTAAIGNGESLRPKQARIAGLFFVRAAGIRC